ncbi:hypothetical protein NUW58_g901 [Xylaria curta]|uniref:Uncharacterized protein n=1 Tax=Xylaria curta TaxID=42375 RepID=A0ACC1PMN5_9PEZI|nr:hypothetical protein NUW58_g901 [Xylaria curta]
MVADSWRTFGPLFDVDDTKYTSGLSLPTIDTLLAAVNDASTVWKLDQQGRFGRTKERFLRFTKTLNDYSFLFAVIPNNDKYTSLITGVLSTIAKACANYQETAEKFSLALDRVSDGIRLVRKSTKVADSPDIRRFVVEFFVGIFDLLCHAMSWYRSKTKRFLGALNKNFDKDLDGMVDTIQQVLKKLSEEANLITQLRIQDVHESVTKMSSVSEDTERRMNVMEAKLDIAVDGVDRIVTAIRSLEGVGVVASQVLNAVQQHYLDGAPIPENTPLIDCKPIHFRTPSLETQEADRNVVHFSKPDLLHYSQQLKKFVNDGRDVILKDGRPTIRSALPGEVVSEMEKWMTSSTSKMLWVEGISSYAFEPVLSLAALHICSVTADSGIPCVSHFCTTPQTLKQAGSRDPTLTHAEATCVSLLYSIIIQLCEKLPDEFAGTGEFDHHFQLLDGTLRSLEAALGLIKDLFAYSPPLTVWILDRFPFAGTTSTSPYIGRLIAMLRSEDRQRVTKVLFTTEGNTPWIAGNLRANEWVSASRMALNRPGRLMAGARSPS